MESVYPLLGLRDVVQACDQNLAATVRFIQILQTDTEGRYPPDATQLLANLAAVRELLGWIIPPACAAAIHAEHEACEAEKGNL